MYYEFTQPVKSLVSHRTLAINRGEKEDVLRVSIEAPEEKIIRHLGNKIIKIPPTAYNYQILQEAIKDSYKRLIQPAVEREIRNRLTEEAEEQAINVFSENLRNLLLQPPLKGRTILGIDPAYRTGCKLAVVDETGKVHDVSVMYPNEPHNLYEQSEEAMLRLIEMYKVELIAIGNGNLAVALATGGKIFGIATIFRYSIEYNDSILHMIGWGTFGFVLLLSAYFIFEFLLPTIKVDEEIGKGNVAVGFLSMIFSVGISFVIGASIG